MGFVARHKVAVRTADGVGANARVNQAGEGINTPWLIQMSLEGRVFMAGQGVEQAAQTVQTALNDTLATYALAAPSGGKLIIPVRMSVYQDVEGDGANICHMAYCQSDKSAFTGGTVLEAINCRGGSSPPSAAARLSHTVTLDAIVDDEYVSLQSRLHIIDNWQSTEAVAGDGGGTEGFGESRFEFRYDFLDKHVPLVLDAGAFVAFYQFTGTSGDAVNTSWVWVELPSEVYLP